MEKKKSEIRFPSEYENNTSIGSMIIKLSSILFQNILFVTILLLFSHFFFYPAPEEGLYCKPKYRAKFFQYVLVVLSTLFIFDHFSRQDQFAVFIFRFN